MSRFPRLPSAVAWAHSILSNTLRPDSLLVDATAGNGYDSLFLAPFAAPNGHLFIFDIQQVALASTKCHLEQNGVSPDCLTYFLKSHSFMRASLPQEVHGKIDAVVFNLGYLPGQSKTLTTIAESTLSALDQALELLKKGGLLTVVTYPGHPEGAEESLRVSGWMHALPSDTVEVQRLQAINRKKPAPELWIVRKSVH